MEPKKHVWKPIPAICPEGHEVNVMPTERAAGQWWCNTCETHYPEQEWKQDP